MDRLSIIYSYCSNSSVDLISAAVVNHNCYLQRLVCTVHRLSSTADKNVFLYKQLRYYFNVCVVHFNNVSALDDCPSIKIGRLYIVHVNVYFHF